MDLPLNLNMVQTQQCLLFICSASGGHAFWSIKNRAHSMWLRDTLCTQFFPPNFQPHDSLREYRQFDTECQVLLDNVSSDMLWSVHVTSNRPHFSTRPPYGLDRGFELWILELGETPSSIQKVFVLLQRWNSIHIVSTVVTSNISN